MYVCIIVLYKCVTIKPFFHGAKNCMYTIYLYIYKCIYNYYIDLCIKCNYFLHRVLVTNSDNSLKTHFQDGQEVPVTRGFPSDTTYVRGNNDDDTNNESHVDRDNSNDSVITNMESQVDR